MLQSFYFRKEITSTKDDCSRELEAAKAKYNRELDSIKEKHSTEVKELKVNIPFNRKGNDRQNSDFSFHRIFSLERFRKRTL